MTIIISDYLICIDTWWWSNYWHHELVVMTLDWSGLMLFTLN